MKQEFIREMVAPSEKKIVSSTVDFSCKIPVVTNFTLMYNGRSQNTVPIASTQVAIKGIVQYSTTH